MLPLQGLFRTIRCPYYVAGLCERPHCLFRHTKSDLLQETAASPQKAVVSVPIKVEPVEVIELGEDSGEEDAQGPSIPVSDSPRVKVQEEELEPPGRDNEEAHSPIKIQRSPCPSEERRRDKRKSSDSSSEKQERKRAKKVSHSSSSEDSERRERRGKEKRKEKEDKSRHHHKERDKAKEKEKRKETPSAPVAAPSGSGGSGSYGKRREAHPGAAERKVENQPKLRPAGASSLQASLAKRYESQKGTGTGGESSGSGSSSSKKRIAHVSNVSELIKKTETESPKPDEKNTTPEVKTVPKTSTKGVERVAHPKAEKVHKRPLVHLDSVKGSGKIPSIVRQKVLDQLFDAAVKIYGNAKEAFKRATEEESALEGRSKAKPIYLSVAVSRVRALRKEAEDRLAGSSSTEPAKQPSEIQHAKGNGRARLSGHELYQELLGIILTDAQLQENGYPKDHPNSEVGRAYAVPSFWDRQKYVYEPTRRTCDRCAKVYQTDPSGKQLHEAECPYHPGKTKYERVGRAVNKTYSCCGSESGAPGCAIATYHVPKSAPVSMIKGFVSSILDSGPEETLGSDEWDIVAIDCEMIYTTAGNEVARATCVGANEKVLFDTLVKPENPILDYNTTYSGLTAEIMANARMNLREVQAVLLSRIKRKTILVGHSLESDLIGLRFKHDLVVDTSVLFPHKRGYPYKRALKNITSEKLELLIQDSVDGHDSAEDARAALKLAIHYIMNNRQAPQ